MLKNARLTAACDKVTFSANFFQHTGPNTGRLDFVGILNRVTFGVGARSIVATYQRDGSRVQG